MRNWKEFFERLGICIALLGAVYGTLVGLFAFCGIIPEEVDLFDKVFGFIIGHGGIVTGPIMFATSSVVFVKLLKKTFDLEDSLRSSL